MFALSQKAVSQAQPVIAVAGSIPISIHEVDKVCRGSVEIEFWGETKAQPAREIVAIGASSRPLPF
jgi:hypothetical protein